MRFASAVAFLTLLLTAQAQPYRGQPGPWKRFVDGDRFDTPAPYTLAHFIRRPALLSGRFCPYCSPRERLSAAKAADEPKAEIRAVGKIRGLTIYDVFYSFHREGAVDWKSILVRTGPNRYREIYHVEAYWGAPEPSFLVKTGQETLLGVADYQYKFEGIEGYWCFGAAGPELLDFTPVWDAAQKAIPPDHRIFQFPNASADFSNSTVSVPVWVEGAYPCCDFRGAVKVRFQLKQCRISVRDAVFQPGEGGF
jgi:hypothetical protein